MKTDYTMIDLTIMTAIQCGESKFECLSRNRLIMKEAGRIAAEDNKKPSKGFQEVVAWRVVDRRLQAMRKAGKIAHAGGRWALTAAEGSENA